MLESELTVLAWLLIVVESELVTIGSNLSAISLICLSSGVFLPFFLCHGLGLFLGLDADFLLLDFLVAILTLVVTAGFRLRVVCF